MAGRPVEATTALDVLRQWHPKASMAWVERSVLYTPRRLPHFLEGMRKSGLKE
jgi:hypothetical protein